MLSRMQEFTEEQLAYQRVCRDFVDKVVLPFIQANREREWLAPPEARWPKELLLEADRFGLRTLGLPETYGGLDLDTQTQVLMVEELARGDPGFSTNLSQNWKIAAQFGRQAPSHLQDVWFKRFKEDPTFLWAHCITEPRGASDRVLPYNAPEASLQTRAVLKNGEWVINGVKHYVSNAGSAQIYIVYANTDPTAGVRDGVSSFLIPRDAPGFSIGRFNEKLGQRMVINAELVLEDCRVPEDHLLVKNKALGGTGIYMLQGKALNAARALGVMQAAFEDTSRYVQEHFQGGRILIKHQIIAARMADMATQIEAARSMVYRVARAIDNGASDAQQLALMVKLYCSEVVFEVCRQAMEIHGGAGVMLEMGIEKHLRDSTIFSHTDGTADIHRFKIAKALFPETAGIYAGPEPPEPDGSGLPKTVQKAEMR